MVKFSSEDEFLQAFRPVDRDEVQLPFDVTFPLTVKDYMAWVEPSGHRTFLVFEDSARQGTALGVVFKRTSGGADLPAAMCDWCHAVRGGGAVGLMTVTAAKNRRIGLTLCRDLSCKEKTEGIPGVHDLRESLNSQQKTMRIVSRMTDFARRHLF